MPALHPYFVGEQDVSTTTQWTVAQITAVNGVVLPARSARTSAVIVNTGTNALYVNEGSVIPTVSSCSGVVTGGSAPNDGSGGMYQIASYTGVVTVAATGLGCTVTERWRQFS